MNSYDFYMKINQVNKIYFKGVYSTLTYQTEHYSNHKKTNQKSFTEFFKQSNDCFSLAVNSNTLQRYGNLAKWNNISLLLPESGEIGH